jgi:hypothetical protein
MELGMTTFKVSKSKRIISSNDAKFLYTSSMERQGNFFHKDKKEDINRNFAFSSNVPFVVAT